MSSPVIISLAILKANWDVRGTSYLDSFVPIVAECIRIADEDYVSLPSVRRSLQMEFGLTLPSHAIKRILTRVAKRGYIRSEHRVYRRDPQALAALEFKSTQHELMERQEAFIGDLIDFCSGKFGVNWTEEEAEAALQSYLEEY